MWFISARGNGRIEAQAADGVGHHQRHLQTLPQSGQHSWVLPPLLPIPLSPQSTHPILQRCSRPRPRCPLATTAPRTAARPAKCSCCRRPVSRPLPRRICQCLWRCPIHQPSSRQPPAERCLWRTRPSVLSLLPCPCSVHPSTVTVCPLHPLLASPTFPCSLSLLLLHSRTTSIARAAISSPALRCPPRYLLPTRPFRRLATHTHTIIESTTHWENMNITQHPVKRYISALEIPYVQFYDIPNNKYAQPHAYFDICAVVLTILYCSELYLGVWEELNWLILTNFSAVIARSWDVREHVLQLRCPGQLASVSVAPAADRHESALHFFLQVSFQFIFLEIDRQRNDYCPRDLSRTNANNRTLQFRRERRKTQLPINWLLPIFVSKSLSAINSASNTLFFNYAMILWIPRFTP